MRSCSRVDSQLLRRASRGWDEIGVAEEEREEGEGPTPERRVSCRPGAEGAEVDCRWVKEVVCESWGTMRRDWEGGFG